MKTSLGFHTQIGMFLVFILPVPFARPYFPQETLGQDKAIWD